MVRKLLLTTIIICGMWSLPSVTHASSLIDKIDYGSITIAANVQDGTVNLPALYYPASTSLIWLGSSVAGGAFNASTSQASLSFSSAGISTTTVYATRGTNVTAAALTVKFVAVQWTAAAFKSVQRFTIVMNAGATAGTATITSVNTSNAFANWIGQYATSSVSSDAGSTYSTCTLTNATTLTVDRSLSVGTATTTCQVTEFAAGVADSIQAFTIALNGVANPMTANATISAVTTGESLILYGGVKSDNNNIDAVLSQVSLTNSTTIKGERTSGSANTTIAGTIIDFNSAYLGSPTQSGTIVMNGVAASSTSISKVQPTLGLVSYGGTMSNTSSNATRAFMTLTLDSNYLNNNAVWVTAAKGTSASIATSTFMLLEGANDRTQLYYALGQNTNNHAASTSALTVTIVGRTGTFSEAQTNNSTGVGDQVKLGGVTYYIAGRTSTSVWTLQTSTGTDPVATTSARVNSINHPYTAVQGALGFNVAGNASTTNFMNTSDLVSNNFWLNIPAYRDTGTSSDTNSNLGGWISDPTHWIRLYAPTSTNQVNTSQCHNGTFDPTVGFMWDADVAGTELPSSFQYFWIDCIQFRQSAASRGNISANGSGRIKLSNNIFVHSKMNTGTLVQLLQNFDMWNNVFINGSIAFDSSSANYGTSTMFNNTFYNYKTAVNGFNCNFSYNIEIVNNIFASSTATADFSTGTCAGNLSGYNSTASSSLGYVRTGKSWGNLGNDRVNQTFTFVNPPFNLKLASGDTGATDVGFNLSVATDTPFNTDIIGTVRPQGSAWDIGMSEFVSSVVNTVSAIIFRATSPFSFKIPFNIK